jgi:hypothetical protein
MSGSAISSQLAASEATHCHQINLEYGELLAAVTETLDLGEMAFPTPELHIFCIQPGL